MNIEEQQIRDPVCNMIVSADQNAIDYLGIHFAFCSLQCKERFLANPHLYIGAAEHKSPKQEGREILKRRHFRLTEPLPDEMAALVADSIRAMMGIKSIDIDGAAIEVTYDLLQATAQQIESQLESAGAALGKDWGQRLRRAFVHYTEETEVDSMETSSSPHQHH
ncbi:MAG TPA: YHS domain-containing protein [Gammaproteobacteria bacterium]|nr:YHS domain-containing protein [Gammaproteobacteria bacterium]